MIEVETLLEQPLQDGIVTLKRSLQDGEQRLHFYAEIRTHHPADILFEQLVLGLTESEKSWIWPLEYESAPAPPEGGVKAGCICHMTYRVPRFDRPELLPKPVTYSYSWPRFDRSARLLEYVSVDHPLQGGAVVRVDEQPGTGSTLVWDGAYTCLPGQDIVVQSMLSYIPLLYRRFEELIEAGPAQVSA